MIIRVVHSGFFWLVRVPCYVIVSLSVRESHLHTNFGNARRLLNMAVDLWVNLPNYNRFWADKICHWGVVALSTLGVEFSSSGIVKARLFPTMSLSNRLNIPFLTPAHLNSSTPPWFYAIAQKISNGFYNEGSYPLLGRDGYQSQPYSKNCPHQKNLHKLHQETTRISMD